MNQTSKLTDRTALEQHRKRAKRNPEYFLFREIAADLEERLSEINKSFTRQALVGGLTAPFLDVLDRPLVTEDTETLNLERTAHDLVVHALALHWSDDPIGQIVQSRLALEPDGLFVGIMFGGQTLNELRTALSEAEARTSNGISPRVLSMGDLRDLGSILQRAGLALPVADGRTITVRYKSLGDLVRDLRGMGETNALSQRQRRPASRRLFSETEDIYRRHFADEDGLLIATFEVVFLTGWAPSDSQPKPLRPGSATQRLADALGTTEQNAGEEITPPKR